MNTWCSNVGKASHQVVIDLFDMNPDTFVSNNNYVAYVADALKGLRYIYEHPDSVVSVTSLAVVCYYIVVLTRRSYRLTMGHTAPS